MAEGGRQHGRMPVWRSGTCFRESDTAMLMRLVISSPTHQGLLFFSLPLLSLSLHSQWYHHSLQLHTCGGAWGRQAGCSSGEQRRCQRLGASSSCHMYCLALSSPIYTSDFYVPKTFFFIFSLLKRNGVRTLLLFRSIKRTLVGNIWQHVDYIAIFWRMFEWNLLLLWIKIPLFKYCSILLDLCSHVLCCRTMYALKMEMVFIIITISKMVFNDVYYYWAIRGAPCQYLSFWLLSLVSGCDIRGEWEVGVRYMICQLQLGWNNATHPAPPRPPPQFIPTPLINKVANWFEMQALWHCRRLYINPAMSALNGTSKFNIEV